MGSRKRGRYCQACGDFLPNEKFGGKGHRKHLCKDCKNEGRMLVIESDADYDRNFHLLSKAIRNCMIVFMEHESFFLFEYQKSRYIIGDELSTEIYVYQRKKDEKFFVSEKLQKSNVLMDVLYKKYYETMDNDNCFDYEELLYDEYIDISKKRRQYIEVVSCIQQLKSFL